MTARLGDQHDTPAVEPARDRPLRFGMVGGGRDAFFGAVHRQAAGLDGDTRLVAGALSSTPEKAVASAIDLGIDPARAYPSWQAMLEGESALPPEQRINFVSIVTPNHTHAEIAGAFAEAGFHVVLDKPMTLTTAEADALVRTIEDAGVVCCVTYTFLGYPMIREARHLVRSGALGAIRKVYVDFRQGWLGTLLEAGGHKQASWRTDPALAGAGALGDIGVHAEALARWVTGARIRSLCAEVSTMVEGRRVDDDASVLLRLSNGARGVLNASQVCTGEECALTLRVFGDRGGLFWSHEQPERLEVSYGDRATEIITRAGVGASPSSNLATRLPQGHPEGFIEALAGVYRGAIAAIRARQTGQTPEGLAADYPSHLDGAEGVRFVEAALASARAGGVWTDIERG